MLELKTRNDPAFQGSVKEVDFSLLQYSSTPKAHKMPVSQIPSGDDQIRILWEPDLHLTDKQARGIDGHGRQETVFGTIRANFR